MSTKTSEILKAAKAIHNAKYATWTNTPILNRSKFSLTDAIDALHERARSYIVLNDGDLDAAIRDAEESEAAAEDLKKNQAQAVERLVREAA